ncbi:MULTISPECIES: acetyltransferase [Allobranchiibius]|uniref:Sugar O-acyltransferase (Sialic acid O-acetyltransferase NeuD family) n=1 Tax=Allobranchiibius huperziae TaxID=1874116 RepID=A0A853DFQ8_9MICO|nr:MULTISPECIES: acetyltransferase [Allobranchiibius]NYJ75517.1 sugar O-acyltransferase (sialic acid O-acetyltransferase NeuD family) [Allobranchiibius huperziae]UIJ36301.1 acetyltransferase [Allobranchiibius sp. GilTou73]
MDVVIVGAGGHGRETLHCIRRASVDGSLRVLGIADDRQPSGESLDRLERIDIGWLGPVESFRHVPVYLGIGNGIVRCKLNEVMTSAPPVVDPSAVVGDDVRLDWGSIVFAQATVTTNVRLGRHTHIGRGAAVGHDCTLEDGVSVMPLASISGDVSIGKGAFVGTGALIRQGVRIGAAATIGMGAVVLEDVPDAVTVVGNPARVLGKPRHTD